MEKLLTIDEAAEALGTTSRFPRRLVAERAYPVRARGSACANSDVCP